MLETISVAISLAVDQIGVLEIFDRLDLDEVLSCVTFERDG